MRVGGRGWQEGGALSSLLSLRVSAGRWQAGRGGAGCGSCNAARGLWVRGLPGRLTWTPRSLQGRHGEERAMLPDSWFSAGR